VTGFSYQLYSSRKFPPLGATLDMLADAGYAQVEGFGGLYDDMAALKAALHATGLTMASGHFALDMLESEPARVLEISRALGMAAVFVPFIAPADRPGDSDGWRVLGARLERAGAPIREAGLVFGYHNHDFEFAPTASGDTPMALLLEGGPSLKWEADIAWVVRGGADPIAWIEAQGDRIVAAHVKDIAPTGEKTDEDGWADVGDGTMDWPAIMAALRKTPCELFVMEHDNPGDDRRFAERSIAYAGGLA